MVTGTARGTWGACRFCGAAVSPGAPACALCGAERPLAASEIAAAPRKVRRRLWLTRAVRATAVLAAVIALAAAIVPAAISGPPKVADPLTTQGTYTLSPGASTLLVGEVTGGDFVVGNYSTIDPYGASVTLAVYNSSGWRDHLTSGQGAPVWSLPAQSTGRIIFSALYTDTYTFVITNPYAASTGLVLKVFVLTQYESNVGASGFA